MIIQNILAGIVGLFLVASVVGTSVLEQCVPPVSPKPQIEYTSKFGAMTIAPQISQERKDNTITVSVTPSAESRAITLARPIMNKRGGTSTFTKDEILDWGPRNLPEGASFRAMEYDGAFRWEAHDISLGWFRTKPVRLPANQKYWVQLRAPGKTIPDDSDQNAGPYGWTAVDYYIQNDNQTSDGRGVYYIGGIQRPVLKYVRIGDYTSDFWMERPVNVKAGESFNVEAAAPGQGGNATIKTQGPRLVGPETVAIKAGGFATWKLVPRGRYPIELDTKVENNCGSQYTQRLRIPVVFDFSGLTKEKVRLTTGLFSVFPFEKPNAALPLDLYLQVMDQGIVVVGVPDAPLAAQVVYKDTGEVVKDFVVTPAKIVTDEDGKARVTLTAPRLTKEEASRGLMALRLTAPGVSGVETQLNLPLTGVSVAVKNTAAPSGFSVATARKLDGIIEGDRVHFAATLHFSDGSTKEVKGVEWRVVGSIGSITSNGVFTAKLGDDVSELGGAQGAIVAGYKDTNGKDWAARTPLFEVEARVEEVDDERG